MVALEAPGVPTKSVPNTYPTPFGSIWFTGTGVQTYRFGSPGGSSGWITSVVPPDRMLAGAGQVVPLLGLAIHLMPELRYCSEASNRLAPTMMKLDVSPSFG